jgi:hypothetical protein
MENGRITRPLFCGALATWRVGEFGMHVVECDIPPTSVLNEPDQNGLTFTIPIARRWRALAQASQASARRYNDVHDPRSAI